MKKFLAFAFLAFASARLSAINVAHSLSSTSTPAESVSTQNVLWLLNPTTGRISQMQSDAAGNLKVTVSGGGSAVPVTFPAGTFVLVSPSANTTGFGVLGSRPGSGVFSQPIQSEPTADGTDALSVNLWYRDGVKVARGKIDESGALAATLAYDSAYLGTTVSAFAGAALTSINGISGSLTYVAGVLSGMSGSLTYSAGVQAAMAGSLTYSAARLDGIFASLTFSASGYVPVSGVVQQATTVAFAVNLSQAAGTTSGPFYFGLSCTDTAATIGWFAGTASVTPASYDAYATYSGGTLKIYDLPFQSGTIINIILPAGATARNVFWGIYRH